MRKSLVLLFAAALVLAFTLPAEAQAPPASGKYLGAPDFSFRGVYRQWGGSSDNTFDFDDDTHDARRHIFQRFNWWLDTSFEGKYGGTFGMEHDWFWGSDSTQLLAAAPALGGGAKGDDLVNGRLKNAYIWFFIPGTPVKVTTGLQGHAIDPSLIMFARDDYFSVRVDAPLIQNVLTFSGAWVKVSEHQAAPNLTFAPLFNNAINADNDDDDVDLWYINLVGNVAKWLRLGMYHQLIHVREGAAHQLDPSNPFGTLGGRPIARMIEGNYLWHGLHARIDSGNFYLLAHGNYFWGDTRDGNNAGPQPAWTRDIRDPSGWAAILHSGLKLGPVDVGVRGYYFSGTDQTNRSAWNGWSTLDAFNGQYELLQGGYKTWGTGFSVYTFAPRGLASVGLDTTWQVTKPLSLNLLAGYFWATDDRDKPVWALLRETSVPGVYEDNKNQGLGFEIDLTATYKIYPNLTLDLVGAYFIADRGLDHVQNNAASRAAMVARGLMTAADAAFWAAQAAGAADNGSSDAWELVWRLTYSF